MLIELVFETWIRMRWTAWSRYFTLHFHVSSCTIKPAIGGIRALRTPSTAWHGILDIVQDMLHAGNMSCVDTDLCTWGATDPYSGKFYQKTMRFACTFDCESMRRQCPKDHEHEIVQGHLQGGPFKGRLRSAISGQYPLPLCDAWASLAKRFI